MTEDSQRAALPGRVASMRFDADRAMLVVSGAFIVLLLLQLLDFGYGRDQGIFAVVGRTIRDGGVPYRDAWDFKPPGIYFVYALAGTSVVGIRVLEAIGLGSMIAAFALISRRYVGDARAGIVGGAVAILTHIKLEFWHTAQPESFGAVLVAWGLAAAALATGAHVTPRRASWLWAGSGLCYGAAALLKPTIGVAACASLLAGLVAFDSSRRSTRLRHAIGVCTPFAIGAAVPVALCLLFFVLRGGLVDLWAAMSFVPHYTRVSWAYSSVPAIVELLARRWLTAYSLAIPVGLALLALFARRREMMPGVLHVGAAIALLLVGVLAQGKLFPYHFGAVLPLTALLAGWGLWQSWQRSAALPAARVLWIAIVLCVFVLEPSSPDLRDGFVERCRLRWRSWVHASERPAIRDRLYSVADYDAADNRDAAAWIAGRTAPEDPIFVYGFTPEIYVSASRPLASRYIYNVPQRAPWSRVEARLRLLQDLQRTPPEVIVVEHGDVMPWVVGNATDSARDLKGFTELQTFLTSGYRHAATSRKFEFYTRAH